LQKSLQFLLYAYTSVKGQICPCVPETELYVVLVHVEIKQFCYIQLPFTIKGSC